MCNNNDALSAGRLSSRINNWTNIASSMPLPDMVDDSLRRKPLSEGVNTNAKTTQTIQEITKEYIRKQEINELRVDLEGAYAAITVNQEAIVDLDDTVQAIYEIKLDANGHVIGWSLVNGTDSGSMTILVDTLKVADASNPSGLAPFIISGGKIYMNTDVRINGNLVVNGTIYNAALANLAVSVSKLDSSIVRSGKIVSGLLTASNIITGTLNAGVVNVINLNASNINTGTLNAGVVNVTNLNASNITTGELTADHIDLSGSEGGQSYKIYVKDSIYGGGYFEASSRGVVTQANDTNSLGVYGIGGTPSSGSGGYFYGPYRGCEAAAYNDYDFYASGFAANYGPFTGAHDGLMRKELTPTDFDIGDIVSDIRVVYHKNVSNTICEVKFSDSEYDKSAIGVVVKIDGHTESCAAYPIGHFVRDSHNVERYEGYSSLIYNRVLFNGVGEGQINVCELGGNIEKGDYITTSILRGKGMKQHHSTEWSVARAREGVDWSDPKGIFMRDGIKCKTIACIYKCG